MSALCNLIEIYRFLINTLKHNLKTIIIKSVLLKLLCIWKYNIIMKRKEI